MFDFAVLDCRTSSNARIASSRTPSHAERHIGYSTFHWQVVFLKGNGHFSPGGASQKMCLWQKGAINIMRWTHRKLCLRPLKWVYHGVSVWINFGEVHPESHRKATINVMCKSKNDNGHQGVHIKIHPSCLGTPKCGTHWSLKTISHPFRGPPARVKGQSQSSGWTIMANSPPNYSIKVRRVWDTYTILHPYVFHMNQHV